MSAEQSSRGGDDFQCPGRSLPHPIAPASNGRPGGRGRQLKVIKRGKQIPGWLSWQRHTMLVLWSTEEIGFAEYWELIV